MKRRAAIVAALIAIAATAVPGRAEEKDLLGTWDVNTTTPDGPMPSVLTVTKVEGKIKAEIEVGGVKRAVSEETFEQNVLRIKVEYDGYLAAVTAKITGDEMEGSWEAGGYAGVLKGKRRP